MTGTLFLLSVFHSFVFVRFWTKMSSHEKSFNTSSSSMSKCRSFWRRFSWRLTTFKRHFSIVLRRLIDKSNDAKLCYFCKLKFLTKYGVSFRLALSSPQTCENIGDICGPKMCQSACTLMCMRACVCLAVPVCMLMCMHVRKCMRICLYATVSIFLPA